MVRISPSVHILFPAHYSSHIQPVQVLRAPTGTAHHVSTTSRMTTWLATVQPTLWVAYLRYTVADLSILTKLQATKMAEAKGRCSYLTQAELVTVIYQAGTQHRCRPSIHHALFDGGAHDDTNTESWRPAHEIRAESGINTGAGNIIGYPQY